MLRFALHDSGDRPAESLLVGAHLLGPDERPVPGRVTVEDGMVLCRARGANAVALCLLFDCGRAGRLMSPTCLLPPREQPYVLSVELARARIKQFIQKTEEWQMFDLSSDHPSMRHFEEARKLLTDALTATTTDAADAAARAALDHAIEANERLAMAHAEILLHRRFAARAASSATLGVRVWPQRDGKGLRELIGSNFDVVVMPFRWREIEVEEGSFRWDPIDRWMEWAKSQGKPIIAGPLLDFSKESVPEWMYVWQHDYDTCRDLVYDYMERVVGRYRAVVGMWNLGCGVNTNENFTFTPEQMVDLVRTASLVVRHMRRGARVMVEVREPFAAHLGERTESMAPHAFIDRLGHEGVKLDAVGVQLLFGENRRGRHARDLMQISNLLDRFQYIEKPLLVSALGVPSRTTDPDGGNWHGPWSPELQSRWISRMFAIAMSKPYVESVFWSDLYDHSAAVLPGAGLLTEGGEPKPALARLVGMRRRLRRPLGAMRLTTESKADS